jgi:hypothetical protein
MAESMALASVLRKETSCTLCLRGNSNAAFAKGTRACLGSVLIVQRAPDSLPLRALFVS